MQQVQQRETTERMSWARAMVFAVGFFFLAAMLVGQIPGYIFYQMTAATLQNLEIGSLGLGIVCVGSFLIIQVIVLLFDPKPLVPPIIFPVLGVVVSIAGLAIVAGTGLTGNQFFPSASTSLAPVLGGKFLWFQEGDIDFVMIGLSILTVGLAMIFYGALAMREQGNPDRRDLGTTPAIRTMLIIAILLLIVFLLINTLADPQGLAQRIDSSKNGSAFWYTTITIVTNTILGIAFYLTLGAFALRLHYLMRPVRKRTMAPLYAVGALGLAQTGVILLLVWAFVYPLLAWMHSWTFIGLGSYLTGCAKKSAVPASCAFSPQAGYIIDAVLSTNSFVLLMAAVWAWKSNRNLVIIGSVVVTAVLGLATLLVHTNPSEIFVALLLAISMVVLATIWTAVARREFAVVGENNLGCLGMWLVVGTCLFIYIASFGFFSLPVFNNETEPNIPFVPGVLIPAPGTSGAPPTPGVADAVVVFFILGILAAIQFYFLVRNRYKV